MPKRTFTRMRRDREEAEFVKVKRTPGTEEGGTLIKNIFPLAALRGMKKDEREKKKHKVTREDEGEGKQGEGVGGGSPGTPTPYPPPPPPLLGPPHRYLWKPIGRRLTPSLNKHIVQEMSQLGNENKGQNVAFSIFPRKPGSEMLSVIRKNISWNHSLLSLLSRTFCMY